MSEDEMQQALINQINKIKMIKITKFWLIYQMKILAELKSRIATLEAAKTAAE